MIEKHDELIKIILVGSAGVGKSSVLAQFADNKFSDSYLTTIGVDFR
jgi:Ras-related protein Rab-1A